MQSVHKGKRIGWLKKTKPSLFDFRKYPIRNLTDSFIRQFNPIKLLKLVMDIPGTEAPSLKGNHLILNTKDIPLVFGDELWPNSPSAVSWDFNPRFPYWFFKVSDNGRSFCWRQQYPFLNLLIPREASNFASISS